MNQSALHSLSDKCGGKLWLLLANKPYCVKLTEEISAYELYIDIEIWSLVKLSRSCCWKLNILATTTLVSLLNMILNKVKTNLVKILCIIYVHTGCTILCCHAAWWRLNNFDIQPTQCSTLLTLNRAPLNAGHQRTSRSNVLIEAWYRGSVVQNPQELYSQDPQYLRGTIISASRCVKKICLVTIFHPWKFPDIKKGWHWHFKFLALAPLAGHSESCPRRPKYSFLNKFYKVKLEDGA